MYFIGLLVLNSGAEGRDLLMDTYFRYQTLVCENASAYKYLNENGHPQGPDATISYISLHKYYTASIKNLPYHVLIVYNNLFCSGSLVRSRKVLTAASCFEKWKPSMPVLVKLGSSHVTNVGQVIEVLDIKTHEYFGHNTTRDNDVAVLILGEHVQFGRDVKKIIMLESEMALRTGTSLDVSGWGSSNLKTAYINSLLWSEMIVMDRTECKKVYKHLITSSNFCARYQPERRLSDNGGPAQFAGVLVGVVSFGATRTEEPFVAVLTNVSYFNRWVNLNAEKLMKKHCKLASIANKNGDLDQDSYTM